MDGRLERVGPPTGPASTEPADRLGAKRLIALVRTKQLIGISEKRSRAMTHLAIVADEMRRCCRTSALRRYGGTRSHAMVVSTPRVSVSGPMSTFV